jgi:hypothetical protein
LSSKSGQTEEFCQLTCKKPLQKRERTVSKRKIYLTKFCWCKKLCTFNNPAAYKKANNWKRHTRFECSVNPKKYQVILTEPTEKTNRKILLSNNLRISANVCSDAGWEKGDIITVKYEGNMIVCTKTHERKQELKELKVQHGSIPYLVS